jgi:hypothetical protein
MDEATRDRMKRRADIGLTDDLPEYDERPETKHKVWLHTFWFGKGPIYTYEGSKLPPRISRAWFTHVFPPYYQVAWGVGIRLRNTTYRFGICYPRGRILQDEFDETLDDMRKALGSSVVIPPVTDPGRDHWHEERYVVRGPDLPQDGNLDGDLHSSPQV